MLIEEKARAYDRVSKEVKDFFEGRQKMYSDVSQTLEYLFPELKESEDEKIRKTIIRFFKDQYSNETGMYDGSVTVGKAIAWLEKQGEKKPIDNVEPKFKVGDTVTVKPMSCHGKVFKGEPFRIVDIIEDNYISDDGKTYSISLQDGWELVEQKPISFDTSTPVSYDDIPFGEKDYELHEATYFIPEGFHAEIEGDKVIIKRGEQKPQRMVSAEAKEAMYDKPKWSEEDEKILNTTISFLSEYAAKGYENAVMCMDWLKSLKQRIGGGL